MHTEKGDLVQKAKAGEFDVIVHGCNCFCTMGAGIAKTIKQVFPAAYEADVATVAGDETKLGHYTVANVEAGGKPLAIVNAYTQYQWKGAGRKADYEALRQVFRSVKQDYAGQRIGISRHWGRVGRGRVVGDCSHHRGRASQREPRFCGMAEVRRLLFRPFDLTTNVRC